MSHCVIRNNTTDLIEKVITDSGENSILYNKIIDKLPDNIQYNQLSDYLKNQIGNGNIKDLSKEEIALGIWNKYSNQDVEGRDVDINDELDIKYIDIDSEVNLNSNEPITNVKSEVEEFVSSNNQSNNNSLFGLNATNQEELEFHINTLNVVGQFLENIGVQKRLVSEFLAEDGSIVEGAVAAANFIKGTVDIIEDLEKRPSAWNKLPEEAAHFWYRLLDMNSPLKEALLTASLTDRKESELRESLYGKTYNVKVIGKIDLKTGKPVLSPIREEAIGQLIAEAIKRIEDKNAAPKDYSFFKKFLEWINGLINKFKNIEQDPFEVAAMKILSSDLSDLMTWEEYSKLNNIVNFADVLTQQSVAPIDYTIIEDIGFYLPPTDGVSNSSHTFSIREKFKEKYTSIIKKYNIENKVRYSSDNQIDFYTKEELDNWVSANIKEYDQRQKAIIQEVRDNQIFFDRLLNKTFKKKSKFLPKTLRKYFTILDSQNLIPLRDWDITQELKQITKKLSKEEKKQIIQTNGYTNIAPTLKVLPDLLQKYKKKPIVLSEPIKIDGAKKQELSILNGIKEMIKLENPDLRTITAEEFVAEAHNWLETNYLLGFANEFAHDTYGVNNTFVLNNSKGLIDPQINPATLTEDDIRNMTPERRQQIAQWMGMTNNNNKNVYHNKVSLRFNDTSHGHYGQKSRHFQLNGYIPSAFGSLTYFYTGKNKWKDAVLLHEIQNDNIEALREYEAEKVDLETSLGRYLQDLNENLLDNITQIESNSKQIVKLTGQNPPKQHIQLNWRLAELINVPLEQGLNLLKQSLNESIELYKSNFQYYNIEKAQDKIDDVYTQKRIFQDFQKKGGIKSLLSKEELEGLKNILNTLNTEEIESEGEQNFEEGIFTGEEWGVRDLKQKKKDFKKLVTNLEVELNSTLVQIYGDKIPAITLYPSIKPRTKAQIRRGDPINTSLNENVNFLLAFSEQQINKELSKNISDAKRMYITARNATMSYNFNVKLSKITQEQYNNLIENYKYNENLLKRLVDEQAQKDIQKESVDISKLSDEEILKDITGEFEEPNEIDQFPGSGFKYKNMYLSINATTKKEAVQEIRDRNNKEKQLQKQQEEFETLKQKALAKKAELEKDYGKIEDRVKQTLEVEMNYFTPLVHHLIQKHINQYGKDFPMYFSGYNITVLTQSNERTALIYAGKEEVNIVDKSNFIFNGINYNSNWGTGYKPLSPFEPFDYFKNGWGGELITQQEYEKAYQQATEREAKEIKYQAALQLEIIENSSIVAVGDLKKLTDIELEEGIKKLNEFKKIPISNSKSRYKYKSNLDLVVEKIMNISNNKPIETGWVYNTMSQVSGVKLIWQDKIDGLKNNAGGYLVDLSNYNYNVPVLYGLQNNKKEKQFSKVSSKKGLVNQNILAEQSSETPFKNILENILKTGKVGNMTDLDLFYAKLLLDNLNTFNPTLRIAKLEDALGSINVATQVITLDEDLIKSGNYEAVVQTVLHEVGHGFLLFPFSAVSGELNEADRMFKLTVNNLFANYKAKHKAANKRFGDDVKNGFKDVEEFLAEFISSKTFREYLYDLDRTLLQRIWDSIKTFFRYKVTRKESNDYKALDTIINSYILNGKTINTLKFKHQLKRTVYNKNKASTLQDVKANIIKEIDRLMIDLRDKSYGSSTLKKLNQLQDQLLDVSEETAIDLYLERVESIFSKTVAKFNAIEKDLHNIDDWDVEKFTDLFYTMNMYKSYLKNFNMWDAGDEQSITEFLRANDMPIDPRIDLLAGKKRSIDFLYSRIAVKLVSRSLASKELLEELNANITDVNKKITYEQLEQSLKYLTDVQDINAPSLQAEAAINSKDLITALVANKIKSALNDAIEEDINLESKLSLLYNKAFSRIESTVNSFKSLFGKYIHEVEYLEHTDYDDSKNKVYSKVKKKAFITEIDYSKYQANKNAFYASLEKLPELPKAGDEDYQILIRDYREIKARNNVKISLWSKQNEELHPDYQKIMDKKKEYLSPEEYNDWFKTNTDTLNGDFKVPESRKDKLIGQNENGDWIIAKKELVTPKKSMYTNPKWASVKDDKFYMALLDAYNEANMKLPKSKRLKYGVIPQRPKSWKEYTIEGKVPKNRLTGKGAKELDEKWGKNYTEVEEKEFWNAGLHTIDTKSYLPIYYTSSIDEDDVSMDILQSVLKFASSSNKFSAFYKINPEISLMKDVVFGTNVIDRMEGRYTIKTDNKGNPTGEKINVTTRANEQLMSFLENSFYNTKVESPKAARIASNVTGFTSFVQLGGNLISSIPNAIYANFVVAQEAIFSKHFGGKGDLVKAHTIVTGSLVHDLAKFSGAVEHVDSKTAYLAKLFQAVQGNHQNEFGENASNKIMNNLFSQNSFFILYSIPEYEIQTTTMVAMMLKTMVKTKSGESISLWDAYEQDETGRVALKPGVIFTKDQRNTLIGKLHKANKELHGNYNKFDTPKLKRIWYGKFLFQFRNHIFEGFKRRFVKEYFDVEAREYKKGYYRSGLDAGLNALTYGYLGLVKLMELAGVQMDKDKYKFAKLSAPDKIDSYKMMVDVASVIGLYFILVGLQAMAKAGDDDDELIYYAITTAKKVQTDISFYWLIDFDAVIKQVRNPAVVMTFAENLLKGTELLVKAAYQDPNDPEQTSYYKIDTGRYKKGDLKAKKHLYKAIPLLNQYERDVKEVAEWYLHPN